MRPNIRTQGIPMWITVLTGLFAIFSTSLGVMGLIDPTTAMGYSPGAEDLAAGWAGRNAGIGLAMGLTIFLRQSAAYAVVYLAAICREIGDSFGIIGSDVNAGSLAGLGVFILLDVIIFVTCLKAALHVRHMGEAGR